MVGVCREVMSLRGLVLKGVGDCRVHCEERVRGGSWERQIGVEGCVVPSGPGEGRNATMEGWARVVRSDPCKHRFCAPSKVRFILICIEAQYCLGEVHKAVATQGVVEVDWTYRIVCTIRVRG